MDHAVRRARHQTEHSQSPQDFRDHLARFPGGATQRQARTRLQKLSWSTLGPSPDLAAVQNFLTEFAKGVCVREAKRRRAYFESDAWEDASKAIQLRPIMLSSTHGLKAAALRMQSAGIAQIEKAQREAELFRVAKEIQETLHAVQSTGGSRTLRPWGSPIS